MKKYPLTSNRSLDGILQKLNSKDVKDGKVLAEIDDEDFSDVEDRKDMTLPGAKKVDLTKRNKKIAVQVKKVLFSQNGKYWAAATPEGLHVYSQQNQNIFTPFELDESINTELIEKECKHKNYFNALIMAL